MGIRVLSGRADLISGGDALVEVALPTAVRPRAVQVTAAGRDVTRAFAIRPGGRFQGLVTGLPVGRSTIAVLLPGGRGARLTVRNHPIGGPVIAGAQTEPWLCGTAAAGLGEPLDAQCDAKPRYSFVYRSTDPAKRGFQPYDPGDPPSDVATTTTDQRRTVPFVVRVETGVIDRGTYAVALLYDPTQQWRPWAPQAGWNGKLVWPFGGDCKPWHKQDVPVDPLGGYGGFPEFPLDPDTGDAVDVGADESLASIFGNGNAVEGLSRGFAVATNSNNKLGSQCNSVVSAESLMMTKEHIVETYGPVRYTIGAGSSGGSMQQQQITSAYPGLLDGSQPQASFPDIWEVVQEAEDCHLLNHYFDDVSPQLWALEPQQEAVTGYMVAAGCRLQMDGPQLGTPDVGSYSSTFFEPSNALGCGLPREQVYDQRTNPRGVRCTLQDYMASIFGRRPADGFANRPYDNVGVQYGLRALESGRITAEQFVDLNEKIGGLDIDWNTQPERSVADPAALVAAHRGALVTYGRESASVPIVDLRGASNVELHSDFHTYVMRARLDRANGHHDNQVVFTGARPLVGDPKAFRESFDLVDEWLARIEADTRDLPLAEKVRRDRPAAAVDTCWIEGRPITDQATCRAAFPWFGDPRIAAGGPLADDVLKCELRPLRPGDYDVAFTSAQWTRLENAFPGGVCDYTRTGVAQQPSQPWTTFAAGPGGRPLGAPPHSRPLRAARR